MFIETINVHIVVIERRARRYGEKMGKMVRGSEATYEELFSYACPKFVTCAPPNMDTPTANTNQARHPHRFPSLLGAGS